MPRLYNEFNAYLEDAGTKTKENGFYVDCSLFDQIVAFSVLFNGLEPLKPLVVKLQKAYKNTFKGYYMIDTNVSDLMDYRRDVDKEFSIW